MSHDKIIYSVVIPVFNESGALTELYRRLDNMLRSLKEAYEIIFVNDGSTDNSFSMLKDIALSNRSVSVLCFEKNYGQHKAVAAGIFEAQGEYVITMDSDLQNPPEEIIKLIEKIREGYDMVAGYRKERKDSIARRLPSTLTNLIIASITGLKMKDYGSMLRIFKKETARATAGEFVKTGGYITMLVARVTHNVAEIEVGHSERYSGASKYNMRKLFTLLFRILFYYNGAGALFRRKAEGPMYKINRKISDGKEMALTA